LTDGQQVTFVLTERMGPLVTTYISRGSLWNVRVTVIPSAPGVSGGGRRNVDRLRGSSRCGHGGGQEGQNEQALHGRTCSLREERMLRPQC
jgi:hypothetical protein